MAAGSNNTGSTEMTAVGVALAILGLSSSVLATKLGWRGIRKAELRELSTGKTPHRRVP
jgi:hypothetical protein